jgi:2-(1,2-epoxy-1,2-dihydrophenyl)acetyl-CoA isomerase
MPEEYVTLSVTDAVATVTIDYPEMRNALTSEVANGLIDAMDAVGDTEARCVVVRGSEGVFCAGGDINAMLEGLETDVPPQERVQRIVEETAAAVKSVATCELPTVAKIDGPAYGAGGTLAVACDLLLASEDAKISFGFRQVGLNVDSGASYFLPRLVGENKAKELVYTGELIGAEEAAALGLFNHVFAPDEFEDRTDAVVERIATGPTVALKHSKRLIEQSLDSSFEQAIHNEAAAQIVSGSTDDHEEGVRAFTEKREPEFEGE